MKSKFLLFTLIGLSLCITLSSFFQSAKHPTFSGQAPEFYTGAQGNTCNSCHGGNPLNNAGGSIVATGLPTGTYVAGTTYNFSIQTTHANADRTRWGFAIRAINSAGAPVGTFSTTNPNAAINGDELGHSNAASTTGGANTFTYSNLRWTAPSSPSAQDQNISFYFVGNAAANGGTSGDFIYAATITNIALPVKIAQFKAAINPNKSVNLFWQTTTEINTDYFEIEKSTNGIDFASIAKVNASGNSTNAIDYNYTDNNLNTEKTIIYYRITTHDLDGRKSYSNIEKVNLGAENKFVTGPFPNPIKAGNNALFNIDSKLVQPLVVKVYNSQGKQISAQSVILNTGFNQFKLKTQNNWSVGIMVVNFTLNKESYNIPLQITAP
jgi:hypothetical protein